MLHGLKSLIAICSEHDKPLGRVASACDLPGMNVTGWNARLKARAKELGLSDAEVARRLDIAQSRYASYARGAREPDFATLQRICRVLRTTPDAILGVPSVVPPEDPAMGQALVSLAAMKPTRLRVAVVLLKALARMPEEEAEPGMAKAAPKARRGSRALPVRV